MHLQNTLSLQHRFHLVINKAYMCGLHVQPTCAAYMCGLHVHDGFVWIVITRACSLFVVVILTLVMTLITPTR